jgi:hypothetical protein
MKKDESVLNEQQKSYVGTLKRYYYTSEQKET